MFFIFRARAQGIDPDKPRGTLNEASFCRQYSQASEVDFAAGTI